MRTLIAYSVISLTLVCCGCGTKTNNESSPVASNTEQPVIKILDEQDRKVMEHTSPRTMEKIDRQESLTINDVIKLSQGGVSDDSIIRYLTHTDATYNLSQAQIRRLQDAGVSPRVIDSMIAKKSTSS